MSRLVERNQNISYLPASRDPFSCDVVFIKTDDCTWIYDTGTTEEAADLINGITGKKIIVISHFHPDHTFNLMRVKYDDLIVSRYTKKYTLKGTVLDSTFESDSNPKVTVFNFPSSHAKGSLAISCGDYAFLGDGTYAKEKIGEHSYNTQLLKAEIDLLESMNVKYVGLSHSGHFIQNKESLILLHKQIYSRRKDNNPVIKVEDYFN